MNSDNQTSYWNRVAHSKTFTHPIDVELLKKYISPDLAELLSDNKTSDSSLNPLLKLSLREMEIMLLLNKGRTLAEICEVLKIQYSTVSTFKHRIMEKLNVKSMHSLYKFMQSYNLDTY